MTKSVDVGSGPKVLEVTEYGEGVTDDTLHNLRGQVHKTYDGAGLQTVTGYDFGGKPAITVRKYTVDFTQHPDWTTIGSVSMESDTYTTEITYDALERLLTVTTPDTGITTYTYEKSGALFSVRVDNVHSLDTDIINEIYYNSKGQRLKTKYENSATTTYEYDTNTFRVTRIRTTRSSDSAVLQDSKYWYDPVGNITLQKDDAQQSVFYDNTVADPKNDYTYDALYRLIKCEGREHAGSNAAVSYNDTTHPLPTDASAMRRYAQYYEYDGVGNMRKMRHTTSGGTGNWTRNFDVDTTSNKLLESSIGSNGTGTETYTYDARGNMIDGMNHLVSMTYNEENRLEKVEITATITAYYQYDNYGQRIRKVIVNTSAATKQVRKYLEDWEVYQKIDTGTNSIILERETLRVDDQDKRIALIDTPTIDTSSTGEVQLLRYQYSNNIQTASLELNDSAAVITYEEYYPFGDTSYQGGRSAAECSLKRYRFTDKERDEETGLNYHGAHYYAPWLARWVACEPINSEWYNTIHKLPGRSKERRFDELTAASYEYCYANPVRFIDPDGEQVRGNEPFFTRFGNALNDLWRWVKRFAKFEKDEGNKYKREYESDQSRALREAKWGIEGGKFLATALPLKIIDLPKTIEKASKIIPALKKYVKEPPKFDLSPGGKLAFSVGSVVFQAAGLALDIAQAVNDKKKNGTVPTSKLVDIAIKSAILVASVISIIAIGSIAPIIGAIAIGYSIIRAVAGKHIDKFIDDPAYRKHVVKKVTNAVVQVALAPVKVAVAIAVGVGKVVQGIATGISNAVSSFSRWWNDKTNYGYKMGKAGRMH